MPIKLIYNFLLIFTVPPQWVKELEDKNADIYSEASLECEAESPDGVEYEWFRNTEPLTSRERHTFSNEQKTLTIEDLKVEDTAMYQCVAKNAFGSAYSIGQLNVRGNVNKFDWELRTTCEWRMEVYIRVE